MEPAALRRVNRPRGGTLRTGRNVSEAVRYLAGGRHSPGRQPHPAEIAGAVGDNSAPHIAVVIPCFRVREHILAVLEAIPPEVDSIYVVDDACPDGSGDWVAGRCADPRVQVLWHADNQGVGGATMTGLRQAIDDGADIIIKLDGDGQMDPSRIPLLVHPISEGMADYAKGNRFYDPRDLASMPKTRLIGNAVLSFLAKLSTGYWHCFDPTNGFVAIHAEVARRLPLELMHRRYFFETDMLFRLNTLRARVVDVPMPAIYGDEESNLRILHSIPTFLAGHLRNTVKRIGYNYFLRDFNLASFELVAGFAMLLFGTAYGLAHWGAGSVAASAGVVMLSALPVILGLQFLLAFLGYDIQAAPSSAIHPLLTLRRRYVQRSSAAAKRERSLAS
jgi:dolichol-phosphate mannosyltransferase